MGACLLCACVCSAVLLYSSSVSSSVTAGPHQTPYSFSHSTKPANAYISTHSDFIHTNGHADTHAQISTATWREKHVGCDPCVENRISFSGKDGRDLRGMVWRGVGRKKLLDILQSQNVGKSCESMILAGDQQQKVKPCCTFSLTVSSESKLPATWS